MINILDNIEVLYHSCIKINKEKKASNHSIILLQNYDSKPFKTYSTIKFYFCIMQALFLQEMQL